MSGRLDDRVLLVAGGTGGTGEGIVRRLLAEGARVVVPSRSEARLDELRGRIDDAEDLTGLVGDVGTEAGAEGIRDRIAAEVGELDGVVASVGSWWSGPSLVDLGVATWDEVLHQRLTTHFVLARTFLPGLADRPGASYTMLCGGSALAPVKGSGPVSVAAAAQVMLRKVLSAELADREVRINMLLIDTSIATRDVSRPGPEWLTPDEVGRYAVWLASDAAEAVRDETIVLRDRSQLDSIP